MHKKKNSESVLAGEMILTFYKPEQQPAQEALTPRSRDGLDANAILKQAFDDCLKRGMNSFTSEALFNRLILALWERRALNCLKLDRAQFSSELERRGWAYDEKRHVWEHKDQSERQDELALAWK